MRGACWCLLLIAAQNLGACMKVCAALQTTWYVDLLWVDVRWGHNAQSGEKSTKFGGASQVVDGPFDGAKLDWVKLVRSARDLVLQGDLVAATCPT